MSNRKPPPKRIISEDLYMDWKEIVKPLKNIINKLKNWGRNDN